MVQGIGRASVGGRAVASRSATQTLLTTQRRFLSENTAAASGEVPVDAGDIKGKKRENKRLSLECISVTAKAADRIKEMIDGKEDVVGVHLSVKRRGCNGYSYIMNYAKEEDEVKGKNELVQNHGVKVLVDPKAIFFVVGTTMDYNETDLAAEFTFVNPNIKGECGCGESFNI